MNPKNPQSTPRAPQERPKATQEHPKSTQRAQNGPKGVLKMSPKVSQNDPEPVPKKDQKMRSYWPPKSAETIYIYDLERFLEIRQPWFFWRYRHPLSPSDSLSP